MPDFKKEWLEKASIDFFAPFINLWLACNSWYKSHYAEVGNKDRELINKIKSDFSLRNHLYTKFKDVIDKPSQDGISFRANLEMLHYSLERANLRPERIKSCLFREAVIDYKKITKITNLIVSPSRTAGDGSVDAFDAEEVIKLDSIYITSDKEAFFSGLFEIIYQVRCILVHGNLIPEKDEHNVVKYCYLILWDLMN